MPKPKLKFSRRVDGRKKMSFSTDSYALMKSWNSRRGDYSYYAITTKKGQKFTRFVKESFYNRYKD